MLFTIRRWATVTAYFLLAAAPVAAQEIPQNFHGLYAGAGQTCQDVNGRLEVEAGGYFNYIQRRTTNGQTTVDVHRCNVTAVKEGPSGTQMAISCTVILKDHNVMRAFEPTIESWTNQAEGILIDGEHPYKRCP